MMRRNKAITAMRIMAREPISTLLNATTITILVITRATNITTWMVHNGNKELCSVLRIRANEPTSRMLKTII
jgi:hypothetical protein